MDLLTVQEAAKELGITRQALYQAVREGRLKTIKILGKIGVPSDELRNYTPVEVRVRAGKERGTSKPKANTSKAGKKGSKK